MNLYLLLRRKLYRNCARVNWHTKNWVWRQVSGTCLRGHVSAELAGSYRFNSLQQCLFMRKYLHKWASKQHEFIR